MLDRDADFDVVDLPAPGDEGPVERAVARGNHVGLVSALLVGAIAGLLGALEYRQLDMALTLALYGLFVGGVLGQLLGFVYRAPGSEERRPWSAERVRRRAR